MKIQYLAHSFFKFSFKGLNVLVDPFINHNSKDAKYKSLIECPVCEDDLNDISLILVTHEHFDHCDRQAIECIAKRDSACVVAHESVMRNLDIPDTLKKPVSIGENINFKGAAVKAFPAHHPSSFYPMSFLLTCDNLSLFHAGDTDILDAFNSITPDIALLPIGGNMTMDLIDAVKVTKTMKPRAAIPMHYNTFDFIMADPSEFSYRINKSILKTKPIILEPGKSFSLE
ncbi:MAG: metal-dependent hydrolase [Candidatus Diapherotrites archaeon]